MFVGWLGLPVIAFLVSCILVCPTFGQGEEGSSGAGGTHGGSSLSSRIYPGQEDASSTSTAPSLASGEVGVSEVMAMMIEQANIISELRLSLRAVVSRQESISADLGLTKQEVLAECRTAARREAASSVTSWLGGVEDRFHNLSMEVNQLSLLHNGLSEPSPARPQSEERESEGDGSGEEYNITTISGPHGGTRHLNPTLLGSAAEGSTSSVDHEAANTLAEMEKKVQAIFNITQSQGQSITTLLSQVKDGSVSSSATELEDVILSLNRTLASYENRTVASEKEARIHLNLCALDTSNAIALVQQFMNTTQTTRETDRANVAVMMGNLDRMRVEVGRIKRAGIGNTERLSEAISSQTQVNHRLTNQIRILQTSIASTTGALSLMENQANTADSQMKKMDEAFSVLQTNASELTSRVLELHTMEGSLSRLFELIRLNSEKVVFLVEQVDDTVSVIDGLANSTKQLDVDLTAVHTDVDKLSHSLTLQLQSVNTTSAATKEKIDMLRGRYRVLDNRLAHVEVNYLRDELSLCQKGSADILQNGRLENIIGDVGKLRTGLNQTTAIAMHLEESLVSFAQREQSQEQVMKTIVRGWQELEQKLPLVSTLQNEVNKLLSDVPQDCTIAYGKGSRVSGRYLVRPKSSFATIHVECEMDDGGWTILQNRFDGSLKFDREWADYRDGFSGRREPSVLRSGASAQQPEQVEFWLGNDNINLITSQARYTARFDMWDTNGTYRYAEYTPFSIGPADDLYRLDAHGYRGNATDSLGRSSGMAFSTPEQDNDASSTNCARFYTAGWWYAHCHYCNLNGRYSYGVVWFDHDSDAWVEIVRTRIRIRREG